MLKINDNIKNFIISVCLVTSSIPGSTAYLLWSQKDESFKQHLIITISLVIFTLLFVYFFYGSKDFLNKIIVIIKKYSLIVISLICLIIFGGFLVSYPETFQVSDRIAMFLITILSAAYLTYKTLPFLNVRFTKSYFKENLELMENWTAVETTNEQQIDYKELSLKGGGLRKLVFSITPVSPFWRAGFKLSDPNGTILPLRSDKSFLFHLGSTENENRFGITAYINGVWVESLNKTLPFDKNRPINIAFEVNKNNFIKCYINGVVEFEPEGRINPRILKKAFLAAWGDGFNMRVEFSSIGFAQR